MSLRPVTSPSFNFTTSASILSQLTRQSGKWPSRRDEDDGEHEAGPAPLPRRRLEARALASLAGVGRVREEKSARRARGGALSAGEGRIDIEEMNAAGERDGPAPVLSCSARAAHTLTRISAVYHPARTVRVLHLTPSSSRFVMRRYL
jgi:hypothetical protein